MSGSHIPVAILNFHNYSSIPTGIGRAAPHTKVVKCPSMVNHYIGCNQDFAYDIVQSERGQVGVSGSDMPLIEFKQEDSPTFIILEFSH